MTKLIITVCLPIACLIAGCYSVEQSMVERGYRWIRRGQTDKALSTFDGTISKYPASVLAHVGRADALFESKRDAEAVDAYTHVIRLLENENLTATIEGKSEIIGRRFLSYQNQGLKFPFGLEPYLYLRRGEAYRALAISPSGLVRDNFRKAIADYHRALELAPDYTVAIKNRDRLLRERK